MEYITDINSLSACCRVVAEETEQNMLLADVLQALELLVTYGYYDGSDDVEAILIPLSGVLNGFSDIPFFMDKPRDRMLIHSTVMLYQPPSCVYVCVYRP